MKSLHHFQGLLGVQDLHDIRQRTLQALHSIRATDELCADLVTVVDEWVTNVLNYGYQGSKGEVVLDISADEDRVEICVRDRATPFDLTAGEEAPVDDINHPDTKPGGLGLVLIRRMTDQVRHTRSDDGWNHNCFIRNLH